MRGAPLPPLVEAPGSDDDRPTHLGLVSGLTLVGLTLGNLQDERAGQLVLAFDRRRTSALDAALDDVRERFGSDAITRGVLVGRDQGLSVPLLPD